MDKRERIERALNFEAPDRPPYVDSFQHAGLIHHYTDRSDNPAWTTTDVIRLAARVADMVQGWGLGPSLSVGERSVDLDGITWETRGWYPNIVARPFRGADDYAMALEREIGHIRRSAPDAPTEIASSTTVEPAPIATPPPASAARMTSTSSPEFASVMKKNADPVASSSAIPMRQSFAGKADVELVS